MSKRHWLLREMTPPLVSGKVTAAPEDLIVEIGYLRCAGLLVAPEKRELDFTFWIKRYQAGNEWSGGWSLQKNYVSVCTAVDSLWSLRVRIRPIPTSPARSIHVRVGQSFGGTSTRSFGTATGNRCVTTRSQASGRDGCGPRQHLQSLESLPPFITSSLRIPSLPEQLS